MHPVLITALEPLAEHLRHLSMEEAQVSPSPGHEKWTAQQIVEHLILTYKLTSTSVCKHLKSGHVPRNRRNLLEFLLRIQTIGVGYMPEGVPTIRAFRPESLVPQDGPRLSARLFEAAGEMDEYLVAARKKFGIQACGEHPFYGVMRVDEWRRYHSIHAAHHLPQLRHAIRFARSPKDAPAIATR